MASCNTVTRNQTYSLEHSWCNFSIKSFIIQWFSVAQHQSFLWLEHSLTLLSFQFSFVASTTLFQPPSHILHSASTRCSMLRSNFCQLLKIALCCWHWEDKLNCPLTYSVAAISHQSKNCCFYDKFENLTWSWWRRHTEAKDKKSNVNIHIAGKNRHLPIQTQILTPLPPYSAENIQVTDMAWMNTTLLPRLRVATKLNNKNKNLEEPFLLMYNAILNGY